MATNDFLVFGGGSSPNVIDQATYAALTARLSGFQSGTALSAQLNKVWRQSSIMAAVLAQFTANFSGQNSVDDGTTAALLANLQAAINAAGITAPQFDNSTRLATTAFIQRQGLKASGFVVYTATATLPASVCGAVIYTGGPSAFTLTLPPASAVPGGARIEVYSMAGAGVTFSAQGSDTIPATGSKTIVLNAGDTMALQSNGIDHWELVGGSVALLYAAVMAGANWKTPPQFDSSGKLATTAFVQQSGGNFQARKYVNGSGTLAASDTGSWIQAGGNGPSTITLPAPTAFNLTYTITNVTNNSTAVTIATPSANIYNQAMGAPTFLIDVGATVELVSDGSNWTVISHYTRSPIAQSPAQFDNSSRLATTAFVQQALGNYRSPRGYVGNATLSAIDIGAMITWDGNGTLTLPDATAVPGGSAIRVFKYAGPIASVLAANKPGQLNVPTSGADTYTFAVGVYGFFELINESGVKWDVAGELFNQFGTTAAAGDNSTRLATTAFVQRASGAVVGSMRNAAMGVPVASTSATFTADEVVVETALGGVAYKLANFNEAINLATTGMDTGSAPVSGYVGLYAGYNPSTGARKLFASNATSTVLGSVYGGSNPPAGIAATALVSVWPTNGNGQFVPGLQLDREVGIGNNTVLSTSTAQASLTSFSAAAALPPMHDFAEGTIRSRRHQQVREQMVSYVEALSKSVVWPLARRVQQQVAP
ncbi:hypothetical protein [Burkholderia cepacia]|uniref:hypothetical protein n=1 Tax=Burkholderia cepacia TaxID=292 RepID=UPI001F32117F|nr:hypothetical protein [Burkholderia cepacia]UIY58264.1 hypothetical protein LZ568_08615 [Burkholderia cepacia]UIY58343.1 hypothetical protein LZ568_09035 [Burkholderia cepacia]